MKKSIILPISLMLALTLAKAQTAMQFKGADCNGYPVDLFADLDADKAVVLFYYMPSCGACPPPAQKIQTMANRINAKFPGKVKGYAFPYENLTTCVYSSNWVASNNLSFFYSPMDSGTTQVAHYGGFGMPTVVLVGGKNHRVMFSTQSFSTSDTTIMRDSILNLINGPTANIDLQKVISSFSLFPNPASNIISINLELREDANLLIEIVDFTGKQVALVAKEMQFAGTVTKQFNTSDLSDGNYLVRVTLDGKTSSEKLIVSH